MTLNRLNLKLPNIGTDQLWPVIILAGFIFFVSLVPLPPNDFWWHLKIGEFIFTQKEIPTTNMFSWAIPNHAPFVYGAWLGELMLYLIYKLGQVELVIFARNILVLLSLFLVTYETKRRSGSWRIGALTVALIAGMTLNNLVIRPQMWSWIPFVVFLIILSRYADHQINRYWLLTCPAVMVFWVNIHGAYILGGVLIGIFFSGELLRTIFKLDDALTWSEIAFLLMIGILTACAMLVNPQGIGTVDYVIDLMTDQPSQSLIVEWQSPTTTGISNIVFFASILLLIASVAYSKRRLTPTEILLILCFLWLSWSGMRYIVWYGFVVMPILMSVIVELSIDIHVLSPPRNSLNFILAVVIFLPAVFVQPWFVEDFPLPERYWKMVQRGSSEGPLIDINTPLGPTDYLRSNPGGRIFNEMGYGSYLIWAIPDQGIFIDPRVELYPFDQWQDYLRITRGASYNEILARYGADRILLNLELQPELAQALKSDPAWILEYSDERAELWYKAGTR